MVDYNNQERKMDKFDLYVALIFLAVAIFYGWKKNYIYAAGSLFFTVVFLYRFYNYWKSFK